MAIFVPHQNVESDISLGQAINKTLREYVEPELQRRKADSFMSAGIEIRKDGTYKVYLDNEMQVLIEFKNRKINPNDTGKPMNLDLHEIKEMKWHDEKLEKDSAKILVIRFNKDWWVWVADFKKRKELEDSFRVTTTFKIRGAGYLPLHLRKQEREKFFREWRAGLERELPAMWRRNITVSQRYSGSMVYDGNYFDIFWHAQELYVLGYYYSSIIVCRSATEQALVSILTKSGKVFDIHKQSKGPRKLKSIEQLVETCRSYSIFRGKYPISKTAARKLNEISILASGLVHPKHDLSGLDEYKATAIKCMDNLSYVIKKHLNFIKDTGVVSGYRVEKDSVRRLR